MPDHQLVRYKSGKFNFEVLTKVGSVLKYREGKLGWDNVPFADEVFKNFSKAERAKSEELRAAFGTDNIGECMKKIVKEGELQLTTAERKEKVDKKRAEVINYIHKYYTDPKTKLPHPVLRIENALDQLKVKFDPDIPAEKQAMDIVKKLPEILPIKKSQMEGTLKVPHGMVGSVTGIVQKWAQIKKEEYESDGCAYSLVIVPGNYDQFISDLQRVTKGDFQFDIDGVENNAASNEENDGKKPKRK